MRLDVEEDRLAVALEADVPAQAAVPLAPTSVARRTASTDDRTGSAALACSSSGKYIRVARRLSSPRANTDTSSCGACSGTSGCGTGPGLIVTNRKPPSASVSVRPKPRKPSASPRSSGWACPVSTVRLPPTARDTHSLSLSRRKPNCQLCSMRIRSAGARGPSAGRRSARLRRRPRSPDRTAGRRTRR